jgi:coenzyme F420 hydrogenase subunit beta
MNNDPISKVVAGNLCTGCGGCAGAFPELIRMIDDAENGRRPVVEQTPAGHAASKAAVRLCAGVSTDWTNLDIQDEVDAAWGPLLAAWEGFARDPEIRFRGSSGGAVTALSAFALTNGTAAGVAHIAARADDPRLNEAVISRDRAELLRGSGSRYAQASPAETIGAISDGDEPVVFVGKPCDVATVHKAARADRHLADRLPLTIAIFCAGAPNLVATGQLLDRLNVPKSAKLIDLRYRGHGWPGLMQATWQEPDGTTKESEGIRYAEGWGKILQASRRWRCRVCADHTGAFADISVGDPWHAPPEGDTDTGRSLIVARTERGRAFINKAIAAGVIVAEQRSRHVIAQAQPNLSTTQGAVWGRRLAMRALGLPSPKDRGQRLFSLWLGLPIKQKLQSFMGTWKRVLRDRLWRNVSLSEYLR